MGNVCSSNSSTDIVVPKKRAGKKPTKPIDSDNGSEVDEAEYASEAIDSDLEDESAKAWDKARREPIDMEKVDDDGGEKFMATRPYVGAIVAPHGAEDDDESNPIEGKKLKLKYVQGFRGHDTRDNLHINAKGHLVYHAAGVGVVLDPVTHEQKHYMAHNDDVTCLAMHPEKKVVASGQMGKDPRICVWDSTDMESWSILAGAHTRAVTEVAFSKSGKYLASIGADDSHTLVIWDWEESKVVAQSKTGGDVVYGLAWSDTEEDTLCTVGNRHAKFWSFQADAGTLESKKGLFGKAGRIETLITVAYWKGWAITGTTNGNLYIWNGRYLSLVIKDPHVNSIYAVKVDGDTIWTSGKDGQLKKWHWSESEAKCVRKWDVAKSLGRRAPIQSIALSPIAGDGDTQTLMFGTRDGSVFEFTVNADSGSSDQDSIKTQVSGHGKGELWGISTHPKDRTYATVSDDGNLCTWNMDSRRLVKSVKMSAPARSVDYSPEDGSRILVGHKNGKWTIYDSELLEVVATGSGAGDKKVISQVRWSPDGSKFALGGHNRVIVIFSGSGKSWKKKTTLKGHASYITHIDWDGSSRYLQSNCGGYELLFWDATSGKQITSASDMADTKWATQSCTLGWGVQGIWPPASDGTDVNAVETNPDKTLLALADDFGRVSVVKYPCTKTGCPIIHGAGHSSHVTNVKWSADSTSLFTTGGLDASIMEWAME